MRVSKRRDALETQASLLAAAGRLFAEHGFEDTSVRDICEAAHANVAAIRHHFGSKEGLYRTVVVRSHQELLEQEPPPALKRDDDPEAALHQMVEYILRFVLLRRAEHPYAGQLFARELRAPTAAFDELLEHVMQPVRREIGRIVGTLLGKADSRTLRGQCTNFVIGLCVFQELGREGLKRFGYPPPSSAAQVRALAQQVTLFALGGIAQLRAGDRE